MSDWISVKDRLPDTDRRVILYVTDPNGYHGSYSDFGYYQNGEWIEGEGYNGGEHVTHWMEEPKPPKETV